MFSAAIRKLKFFHKIALWLARLIRFISLVKKSDRKSTTEREAHLEALLNDSLIYLKEDFNNANDFVEKTSLNDMIFDIETALGKKDRMTSMRICRLKSNRLKS